MKSDKEYKKEFRKIASENYQKFFPINALTNSGFKRYQCKKCGRFFWSFNQREICGDPDCIGKYEFIGEKKQNKIKEFTDVWQEFSSLFEKKGYKPIKRYPVIARWNPSVEFTIASITDFQPYVVSGEVEPIHKMLTVPQICLRFNDIDSVGLTGRHYTGFTMIGQHAFVPKQEYNQEKYFLDYLDWFLTGMKIDKKDIVIHEDSWAGGGNVGPCLEFFCKGLEIGNQVYMMFERDENDKLKELRIKVLDMGMGQERVIWYLSGKPMSYDSVMPSTLDFLYKTTGVQKDEEFLKKFVNYSGILDFDELNDSDSAWQKISQELNIKTQELKKKILPIKDIYTIAEHSRTLLYALSDGVIPSNVGGAYNLRILFRRMMNIIKHHKWDININNLYEFHAKDLEKQYPELKESLDQVFKISKIEEQKYEENRKKTNQIIQKITKEKQEITTEKLIQLYDSFGINPELLKKHIPQLKIPDNFYSLISEKQKDKTQETQTKNKKQIEFNKEIPKTEILYFNDYKLTEFDSEVMAIKDRYIVLSKTAFYPTSGGQIHDIGYINKIKVTNVFKQNHLIVHELEKEHDFKENTIVHCSIDIKRRTILTQLHTSTHIINGAARKILGKHVWQAGAAKMETKARLDITHYDNLTDEEIKKIEQLSNEIIRKDLPVKKYLLPRNIAEQRFGTIIYQGGAVPGKELRIVEIPGFDVEACGGTHLNKTSEAETIKILKTTKIQDGIIRIEFIAGTLAKEQKNQEEKTIQELQKLLDCQKQEIPETLEKLFKIWKQIVKKKKNIEFYKSQFKEKIKINKIEIESIKRYQTEEKEEHSEIIKKSAEILKTQPEHLINVTKRFLDEIKQTLQK